ncbi:hypothetical protein GCM10027057_03150 [Marisediminicola antarctica]
MTVRTVSMEIGGAELLEGTPQPFRVADPLAPVLNPRDQVAQACPPVEPADAGKKAEPVPRKHDRNLPVPLNVARHLVRCFSLG